MTALVLSWTSTPWILSTTRQSQCWLHIDLLRPLPESGPGGFERAVKGEKIENRNRNRRRRGLGAKVVIVINVAQMVIQVG